MAPENNMLALADALDQQLAKVEFLFHAVIELMHDPDLSQRQIYGADQVSSELMGELEGLIKRLIALSKQCKTDQKARDKD